MTMKASTQLIQAILITLAMVAGMLLLPGSELHSGQEECDGPAAARTGPWPPGRQPDSVPTCPGQDASQGTPEGSE